MTLRTDDERSPRDVTAQFHNPRATGWPPTNMGVSAPLPQPLVAHWHLSDNVTLFEFPNLQSQW